MRKQILFIFLLFMPFLGFSQVVTNGLVAYWPFNGNANDASGNNNGTVNGATNTTDRDDNSNNAYYFDGNDRIVFSEPIGFNQWTISAWINPSLPISGVSPYWNHMTIMEGDSNIELIGMAQSSLKIYTTPIVSYDFSANIGWHHVVFSYDGTQLTAYVDYATSGKISITNPFNDIKQRRLGQRHPSQTAHPFKGKIDEVMIYNRALSSEEVQAIFTNTPIQQWTGSSNESGLIYRPGSVAIGNVSSTPTDYKLYVEEGILTEKGKIALENTEQWADYVFREDYELPNLEEVKAYIEKNQHLPNVPSAEQMVEEGLDVAKNDALLLQKIEELTLYLLQLKEESETLRKKKEALQSQIRELKKENK